MIKHIVMFKLKNAEDAERIKAQSETLRAIPTLKKMDAVINSPEAPEANCEFAIVCDFEDIAGLSEYQVHPVHVEFGKFITPLRDTRACIDYEC